MKTLLFLLLISSNAFAQVDLAVDTRISNKIASLGRANLDSFAKTLSVTYIRDVTRSGSFNIDTLTCPINTSEIFEIEIKGVGRGGKKEVHITNTGGTYGLLRNTNTSAWVGPTGTTWGVSIVSNRVIVTVTGNSTSIAYTYEKQ